MTGKRPSTSRKPEIDPSDVADGRIQRADPAVRHRMLMLTAALSAFGMIVIALIINGHAWLETWFANNIDLLLRNAWMLPSLLFVVLFPLMGCCAYAFIFGQRVVVERRYPPADQLIVRDVRVRIGPSAVQVGRLIQTLAATMLLCCLALPGYAWVVIGTLPVEDGESTYDGIRGAGQ